MAGHEDDAQLRRQPQQQSAATASCLRAQRISTSMERTWLRSADRTRLSTRWSSLDKASITTCRSRQRTARALLVSSAPAWLLRRPGAGWCNRSADRRRSAKSRSRFGWPDRAHLCRTRPAASCFGSERPEHSCLGLVDQLYSGHLSGYTPAVIQTNPAQQELWRVANTAADTILNLQYMVNGTAQAVQVVAIDGYPIASGSSGQPSSQRDQHSSASRLARGVRRHDAQRRRSGAVDHAVLEYRSGWRFRSHADDRKCRQPKRLKARRKQTPQSQAAAGAVLLKQRSRASQRSQAPHPWRSATSTSPKYFKPGGPE